MNQYNTINNLLITKDSQKTLYYRLRQSFLYNSNKIHGSNFTQSSLRLLLDKNIVEGNHTFYDIQETFNSSYAFDYILGSLKQKIDINYLKHIHNILKHNTSKNSGILKKTPNSISGDNVNFINPDKVEFELNKLLERYYSSKVVTFSEIAEFHYDFEIIHPFKDGNGRIGRFIMLKQLLQNNLPLIIISWDTKDNYIKALSECTLNNYDPLVKYFLSLNCLKEENCKTCDA